LANIGNNSGGVDGVDVCFGAASLTFLVMVVSFDQPQKKEVWVATPIADSMTEMPRCGHFVTLACPKIISYPQPKSSAY